MAALLAVDVGLRTGLALYAGDGRLQWYRSQNFGNPARLRRGVHGLLKELPDLVLLVLEGGGPLAEIWKKEGIRRGLEIRQVQAEHWREKLLYGREQRSGVEAKMNAEDLARQVIAWSEAPRPTSLRHDAAEAILAGFFAVLEEGWLSEMPQSLRR